MNALRIAQAPSSLSQGGVFEIPQTLNLDRGHIPKYPNKQIIQPRRRTPLPVLRGTDDSQSRFYNKVTKPAVQRILSVLDSTTLPSRNGLRAIINSSIETIRKKYPDFKDTVLLNLGLELAERLFPNTENISPGVRKIALVANAIQNNDDGIKDFLDGVVARILGKGSNDPSSGKVLYGVRDGLSDKQKSLFDSAVTKFRGLN